MNLFKKMKSVVLLSGAFMPGLLINIAAAATKGSSDVTSITKVSNVDSISNLVTRIEDVVSWTYTIFFIIAIFFILLAAFTYLMAQGDPEKVGKAKSQVIFAVVAIVVALLAVSLKGIISNFLSQGT